MYKSFTVLAVIATHAAAQQCVWPPVDNSVPVVVPDIPTPDPVDVPTPFDITEHLCKAENYKDLSNLDSWWNIDAQIVSLEANIKSLRDRVKAIEDCQISTTTAWKLQYPFFCPATEPAAEDYNQFLPTEAQLTYSIQAAAKIVEAQALEAIVSEYTSRTSTLSGLIGFSNSQIPALQASLDVANKFQAYWNSKGADYKLVKAAYDLEDQTLTANLAAANAALTSTIKSTYTSAESALNQANFAVLQAQGNFEAAK